MSSILPRLIDSRAAFEALFAQRIVVLDGAMGSMIQTYKLQESDFRGTQFNSHPHDLQGNNDLLCLTRPDVIAEIHGQYFAAGADMVETNTFSSTTIGQADYKLESIVTELNLAAAAVARGAANKAEAATPGRRCFVAGAMGPLNRTLSMSPDVNRPDYRAVVWDSGRTLSGQTVGAFYNSVRHAKPFSVGINCALGGRAMRPYVEELAGLADCYVTCYPNAGLPNAFGGYDETPADMAGVLGEFAASGFVNLVGGCCGSTPAHIAAIAAAVRGKAPRKIPTHAPALELSGLEPLRVA
jgi:5-methyltetrahydrofolate--homocysteine methyltransferase